MDERKKNILMERLQATKVKYAAGLPEKIQSILKGWDPFLYGPWHSEQFEVFHRQVHTLAGSAGTFGFPKIGQAARGVEMLLKLILESGQPPDKRAKDQITAQLISLNKVYIASTSVQPPPLSQENRAAPSDQPQPIGPAGENRRKQIIIVDEPGQDCQELASQLHYYGYGCRCCHTLPELREEMDRSVPSVLLMNIDLEDGLGVREAEKIHRQEKGAVQTVFISSEGDLPRRLSAIRAGGIGFFQHPIDLDRLMGLLDGLFLDGDEELFRVLIVDDSKSLAQFHADVLQGAGMHCHVVTDPLKVTEPLEQFQPDLILMDLYMPDCTGWELASVIRQHAASGSIPIVFLSVEKDWDRQLLAISKGGDDFLTKPIEPDHLVLSVQARIKWARKCRSNRVYDGLTGLLNHSATTERLVLEVERSKREKSTFSFALIDLDGIQSVNESHGYPMGDQVIKSLARLLKKRMRTTDIVGRIGGEEFSVLFLGATVGEALEILEEVRLAFSRIEHRAAKGLFNQTFSCGVVSFPDYFDSATLQEKARKALSRAKQQGKNRVEFD
ncbi:MAG: diguanylate cyclase [Magnetococcales bacterium]|nr:diguanylate cyclase [Magnetococcales bacterium]